MTGRDANPREEINTLLSDDERTLRLAAFRSLLAGTPASALLLIERAALSPAGVTRALRRLADVGLIVRDEAGNVIGCWGLTLAATSHRLHIAGRDYHTWCAEDAVGIPAALGSNAIVTSSCFHCGRQVVVEMTRGAVAKAVPLQTCLWLAEAQVGRSMVGCTRPQINFFCSVEHLEAGRGSNSTVAGQRVSLDQVADIGRLWWAEARER